MSRKRLTTRMNDRRAVDNPTIPYPGSVNQPDRQFKNQAEYDNYVETLNHPTPDMRHEWQDNPRDEIGFGIPKASTLSVASVRVAANKAVRIAVLLLGEKVGDEVIEEQARDLMGMQADTMDRTLARFAATQELYEAADESDDKKDEKKDETAKKDDEKKASDDGDEDDEKKDEKKEASDKLVDETGGTKPAADAPQPTVGDGDKKAADDSDEKKDEKKDDESKTAADDEKKEEKKEDDDSKTAADDEKDGDKKDEKKEDDKKEASVAPNQGANEMDIELTSSMDDVLEPDAVADAQLASIFDNDDAIQAAELEKAAGGSTIASEKAGIKKLGGQPRVASQGGAGDDISGIWQTAPDVSDVFK